MASSGDQKLPDRPVECWEADSTASASDVVDDIKLRAPSRAAVLVASSAGAAFLLLGLLLLGLGEPAEDEGWVLALRSLAWCFLCLYPFHVCTCNAVGFLSYGLSPGKTWWSQLLVPGMSPLRVVRLARKRGYTLGRGAAASMVFHGLPLVASAAFLLLRLGGPKERFGLVIVYGAGGLVTRPLAIHLLHKLLPDLTKSRRYLRFQHSGMSFAMIFFYALAGAHSVASLYLDVWPDMLLLPVLAAYELSGTFLIEWTFVKEFVAKPEVRSRFAGSYQGIFPSLAVLMFHGNAEAARFALLLKSAMTGSDWSFTAAMAASFAMNVTFRTGWALKLVQITPIGKNRYQTNMFKQLDKAKYFMGYPRFFALLALVMARLCLGHEALPNSKTVAASALMLVQEVLEDCTVFFASRCGLDAHHRLATPDEAWTTITGPRVAAVPSPESAFMYRPDLLSAEAMPLWAHFLAVFIAQLHFVLCVVFSGWGVPYFLGFCREPPDDGGCMGRGLVWWPRMDSADPCACHAP